MKPMQIECLIRRANGTDVTLDGKTYKFRPVEENGAHVATVGVKAHIRTLLAIPEAYTIYDPDAEDDEDEDVALDDDTDEADGVNDDEDEDDEEDEDDTDPDNDDFVDDGVDATDEDDTDAEDDDEDEDDEEDEDDTDPDNDDFVDDGVDATDEDDTDAEDDDEEDGEPTLEELVANPDLITEEIANAASGADLEMLFHAKMGRPPNPQSKDPKRREYIIKAIKDESQ